MRAFERCLRGLGFAAFLAASCHPGGAQFPWGSASKAPALESAEVSTLNTDYRRTRSQVWVRQINKPTRAALDYAAYHANFMIADPEPETPLAANLKPDTSHPFAGKLEGSTLTSDFTKTPLTAEERAEPLAFAPLSEFLQSHKVDGAAALAAVGAAVHDEKWGMALPPGSSGQTLSELYLHAPASGPLEVWAKVEFQPWFTPFSTSADQDGDGFPELYGKVSAEAAPPALIAAIQKDYQAPVLSPAEVKAWANQLSSYWYPSFNTDLIPVGATWPDDQTEANIKQELGGKSFDKPTLVLRGKPQGKPTYNVFLISGEGEAAGNAKSKSTTPALKLASSKPTPNPEPTALAIAHELEAQGGGSWAKWAAQVAPFRDALKKRAKAMPGKVKALAGKDGFLFYKNGLEYAAGGDLEAQRKGKNPVPAILEFKKELDSQGVDFLFVPVPDKLEIYPEELDPDFKSLSGQVVNPYGRKFIASLSKQGIEVLDLLPAFLAAKAQKPSAGDPWLFQHQDTHWTDRGLRLAAELLSARIKKYPWFSKLAEHRQAFTEKETSFTRFGDLQSRLPEPEQKNYTPETLIAHQVIRADKQPYDDDPDSPIVMLGDSFTGVYELTDAEHAGVSAHIARDLSYPLDLVMSYGGGPNVRQKLMRRGEASLATKKLVIWMMTARDLYDYWEDWEALKKP
jgi:alginate O-acetyltransferase complex protein AlgJ